MPGKRIGVVSIAGFDPSGGAGVLADIKTFEANKVYGYGVVSALTFQNDSEFEGLKWIETDEILKQLTILSKKFKFEYIKIGMIKDIETLNQLISNLKSQILIPNSQFLIPKLIWDPILKATVGFRIHNKIEKDQFISICKNIFLITPNIEEIRILMKEKDEMKAAKELSQYCNVFLKGGHSEKDKGRDYLFMKDRQFSFRPKENAAYPKHGSGCVLSSAITANLAKGYKLHPACLRGKEYVTKFLLSNKTLIGYHKI